MIETAIKDLLALLPIPGPPSQEKEVAEYLHQNDVEHKARTVLIPVLNPDGLVRQQRMNVNGVDRRVPVYRWTEEVRARVEGPALIVNDQTTVAVGLVVNLMPRRCDFHELEIETQK